MTVRARVVLLAGAAAVLGLVAILKPMVGSAEPREIVVTARQMAFHLGGAAGANPTIHVAPGERVRITLDSEDDGFDHDLAVPAWNTGIPTIHGRGRASIVLQAPATPTTTPYVCTWHSSMMKGTIEVSELPSPRSGR